MYLQQYSYLASIVNFHFKVGPPSSYQWAITPISRVIAPVTHLFHKPIFLGPCNSTYNCWRGPPCFQLQVSRLLSRCPPPVPWPTRRWGWLVESSGAPKMICNFFGEKSNLKNDLKKKHVKMTSSGQIRDIASYSIDLKKKHPKTEIEEITRNFTFKWPDRSLRESYGVFLSVLINGLFCKTSVYTCSLFNLRPNCLYYLFDNPKITSPTLRHLIFDMIFPQFFQPKDAPGKTLCVFFQPSPSFQKRRQDRPPALIFDWDDTLCPTSWMRPLGWWEYPPCFSCAGKMSDVTPRIAMLNYQSLSKAFNVFLFLLFNICQCSQGQTVHLTIHIFFWIMELLAENFPWLVLKRDDS